MIKDILKEYLIQNGYDGFFQNGECSGCDLGNLFRCMRRMDYAGIPQFCEPGYKVIDKNTEYRIIPIKRS